MPIEKDRSPGDHNSREEIIDLRTIDELRELSTHEEDLLRDLIDIYVREADSRIANIRLAMSANDMDALAFATHTLRGSSATLGAMKLATQLDQLEDAARTGDAAKCNDLLSLVGHSLDEAVNKLKTLR